jgi:hypothetical protein
MPKNTFLIMRHHLKLKTLGHPPVWKMMSETHAPTLTLLARSCVCFSFRESNGAGFKCSECEHGKML